MRCRSSTELLELILSAMNIYTLIGNVLVSSDKEKATLTPLEPRYPTEHGGSTATLLQPPFGATTRHKLIVIRVSQQYVSTLASVNTKYVTSAEWFRT